MPSASRYEAFFMVIPVIRFKEIHFDFYKSRIVEYFKRLRIEYRDKHGIECIDHFPVFAKWERTGRRCTKKGTFTYWKCPKCGDKTRAKMDTSTGKTPGQLWEHINTPYWKLMGQKAKPKDIALDKYLKDHNMTYGDYRRAREHGVATNQSAFPEFENHLNKYGTKGEPDHEVKKG